MYWLNGKICNEVEPTHRPDDRGLLLGDGLFETIRLRDGKALFLTDHLSRLTVSAKELDIPIERKAIRYGLRDLMDAHGTKKRDLGSARITITRGPAPRGMGPIAAENQKPHMMICVSKSNSRNRKTN